MQYQQYRSCSLLQTPWFVLPGRCAHSVIPPLINTYEHWGRYPGKGCFFPHNCHLLGEICPELKSILKSKIICDPSSVASISYILYGLWIMGNPKTSLAKLFIQLSLANRNGIITFYTSRSTVFHIQHSPRTELVIALSGYPAFPKLLPTLYCLSPLSFPRITMILSLVFTSNIILYVCVAPDFCIPSLRIIRASFLLCILGLGRLFPDRLINYASINMHLQNDCVDCCGLFILVKRVRYVVCDL